MQLPKQMLKAIPKDYFDGGRGTLKLLWEEEWRALGITQSLGWEHYEVHEPEPHILLFKYVLLERFFFLAPPSLFFFFWASSPLLCSLFCSPLLFSPQWETLVLHALPAAQALRVLSVGTVAMPCTLFAGHPQLLTLYTRRPINYQPPAH